MNYVAQSQSPNPTAIAGAIGVPAGIGAILVLGLAVTVVVDPPAPNPTGTTTTVPLPPPPPDPTPEPDKKTETSSRSVVIVPTPPVPFDPPTTGTFPPVDENPFDPVGPTANTGDPGAGTGERNTAPPPPKPTPPPLPDPIAASPRGNPGGWITTRDYRPRWVRSGMEGNARFRLEISASGRVTNCAIIGSTGHNALDVATCRLISKRAKFTPARDSSGAKVSGTYSNSVTWRLPE